MRPAPKKIGVIAYEMEGERSGVGRYLEGLLSGIVELDLDWEWLLFFKGAPFDHQLFRADPSSQRTACLRPIFDGRDGARPIVWEQTRLPKILAAAEIDALFSPGYSLPWRSTTPGFLSLHDLSFERRPEEFGFKERWRRRLLARRGAAKAARVLASSSIGQAELETVYGVEAARLAVVPAAVDRRFFDDDYDFPLADLGVKPPYLLWLATILPRRPIDWAIAAFDALAAAHPDLHLVIAGNDRLPRRHELAGRLALSRFGERIVRLDYVPEAALPSLYHHAELALYPSAYEGFGLPPLEALASGTLPVTTPGQALEELWPDYPFRADFVAGNFIDTVTRALVAPDRTALAARGQALVRARTWRESAEKLVAIISEVLEES